MSLHNTQHATRNTRLSSLVPRPAPLVVVFVAALGVALLFRLLLPASAAVNESSDYLFSYEPAARSLLAGQGLQLLDGRPATNYPPGFALVLAGIFGGAHLLGLPEDIALTAAILLATALSAVGVYLLARAAFGPGVAGGAAALWLTYPLMLWSTKQPNSEIAFLPALYGWLCGLWWVSTRRPARLWYYILLGVGLGGLALIRPIAISLVLLIAWSLWMQRAIPRGRRVGLATLFALGLLGSLLPWEAWLHSQTGDWPLLSTNGLPSIRDGLTFGALSKDYRVTIPMPGNLHSFMTDIAPQIKRVDSFGRLLAVLGATAQQRPWDLAELIGFKALRGWYGTDSGRYEGLIVLLQVPYLVLAAIGARRAWRRGRTGRPFVLLALGTVALFWVMTTAVLSIVRYMMPVMGLVLILVAVALGEGVALMQEWRQRRPEV